MEQHPAADERAVEFINTGEEMLIRARALGQKIQERVWKAMERHDLAPPHFPPPHQEQHQ